MTIEQLKITLKSLEKSLDNSTGSSLQVLGEDALVKIEEILIINSFEIAPRILRIRLNSGWVFNAPSEIIKDAEFIIKHDAFGKDKLIGYNWLNWVYDTQFSLPEKAIEVIEEQLIEIHTLFKSRHEKDNYEAFLLNKMAFIKHRSNQIDEAFELWEKSFLLNPNLHDRNAVVGMLLLDLKQWTKAVKFLYCHYTKTIDIKEEYHLKYGRKLKEYYDIDELNNPDLVGLLFHILRNNEEEFGLEYDLDFFNIIFPKVEEWALKYSKKSVFWAILGDTYYVEFSNYEKALVAYTKMLEGDAPTTFASIKRIHRSARQSNIDFFSLPFKFEGSSAGLYKHMMLISDFEDEGENDEETLKYAKLKVNYGKTCYAQFHDYFIQEKGDPINNEQYLFNDTCSKYGQTLEMYNNLVNKNNVEEKQRVAKVIAQIYIEGYHIAPDYKNLMNGANAFYNANDFNNCITYYQLLIDEYRRSLTLLGIQNTYWYLLSSHIALGNSNRAEQTYLKSKELYAKVGAGVFDATRKFLFIAKKYVGYYLIDKKKEYQKAIPELEWFLEQEAFVEISDYEVGIMSYYLGLCYKNTFLPNKAIKAFQKTIYLFVEAEEGYSFDLVQQSATYIKELGGKPIGKNIKNKSFFERLFK